MTKRDELSPEAALVYSYVIKHWKEGDCLYNNLKKLILGNLEIEEETEEFEKFKLSVEPKDDCSKYKRYKGKKTNPRKISAKKYNRKSINLYKISAKKYKGKKPNPCNICDKKYGTPKCLDWRAYETVKKTCNKNLSVGKNKSKFPFQSLTYRGVIYAYFVWCYFENNLAEFTNENFRKQIEEYISTQKEEEKYKKYIVDKLIERHSSNQSQLKDDDDHDQRKIGIKSPNTGFYILPETFSNEYNEIINNYLYSSDSKEERMLFASYPLGITFYVQLKEREDYLHFSYKKETFNEVLLVVDDTLSISSEMGEIKKNIQFPIASVNQGEKKKKQNENWYEDTRQLMTSILENEFRDGICSRFDNDIIKELVDKKTTILPYHVKVEFQKKRIPQIVRLDFNVFLNLYNICKCSTFELIPDSESGSLDGNVNTAKAKKTLKNSNDSSNATEL